MRATLPMTMVFAAAVGCATTAGPEGTTSAEENTPILRLVEITPADGSQVDSTTVIVAKVAYHIPDFDPDRLYLISPLFAGEGGRLFNRGGGFAQIRSRTGVATIRYPLANLWMAEGDQPVTPLTAAFFLRDHEIPPLPEGDTEGVRQLRTATVGPPGRARTRAVYFNGAGPARSFATEPSAALEEYWTFQPHKAFAMAYDEGDRWTYGIAYGHPSSDAAAEHALAQCQAAAERREIDAPCLLLAIDEDPANR